MNITNLKKVDINNKNSLNTDVCEKLSVMEILRKNLPIRRNAFEPGKFNFNFNLSIMFLEESDDDDDVDSAWSSSNYHSDSDF